MPFQDLADLEGPLELPIRGKVYTLPVPTSDEAKTVRAALEDHPEALSSDATLAAILLGSAGDQMLTDAVPAEWVSRAMLTALSDLQRGRFVAELMWKTGGDPVQVKAVVDAAAKPSRTKAATNG